MNYLECTEVVNPLLSVINTLHNFKPWYKSIRLKAAEIDYNECTKRIANESTVNCYRIFTTYTLVAKAIDQFSNLIGPTSITKTQRLK